MGIVKKDRIQKPPLYSPAAGNVFAGNGMKLPAVPVVQSFNSAALHPATGSVQKKQDGVVVQRFGPVQKKPGVPINDDPALEKEADAMGSAAQRKQWVAQLQNEAPVAQLEGDDDAETKKSADDLETEFDEKETEFSEKMAEADEAYHPGNIETANLSGAPAMGSDASDLLSELSDIADAIETRNDEVNDEYVEEGNELSVTEALGEEISKFDKLIPKTKVSIFKADSRVTEFKGMIDLETERRDEEFAENEALTALRGLWTSPASAKGHFNKHTGDTGLGTETAYLTRAKELVAKAPGGDILRKKRGGDFLYYDKSNGNFAIKSSAGKIRTLFNPSGGESYYNKQ